MNGKLASIVLFTLLIGIVVPVSAVGAASSPDSEPTVVCTAPMCPPGGGTYTCPPSANGCPGGCGTVCTLPTTPVTTTVVCTPPPCDGGGTSTCPPAANGCPGGCGRVCSTPTPIPEPLEPSLIVGALALSVCLVGKKSR